MASDPLSQAVPNELRDFADRSVEQARKAFDGFIGVVNDAIDGQAREASGAPVPVAHLSRLAVGFAERNVLGAFELAHNMVRARDLAQVLELQREFLDVQMKALQSQMRALEGAGAAYGTGKARVAPGAAAKPAALRA